MGTFQQNMNYLVSGGIPQDVLRFSRLKYLIKNENQKNASKKNWNFLKYCNWWEKDVDTAWLYQYFLEDFVYN